jgi:hypothetical protein
MNVHVDKSNDEWIERALDEAGREHRTEYISDDGFTASVIARLPEPLTLPAWRRPVIAVLWLLAGLAVMVSLPGLFDQAFREAVAMLVGHRLGLADVVMAVTMLGAITWSALVYAIRID